MPLTHRSSQPDDHNGIPITCNGHSTASGLTSVRSRRAGQVSRWNRISRRPTPSTWVMSSASTAPSRIYARRRTHRASAPKSPYGATVYKWNFGDGTTRRCPAPKTARSFTTYQYGGTYSVTLTVTDAGGNSLELHRADHGRRWPQASCGAPAPPRLDRPAAASATTARRYPWYPARLPRHHRQAPASRPGGQRGRRLAIAVEGAEEGPGRPLLGQRAGRRPLRGAARGVDRQAHRPARRPRDRPRRRARPRRS